MGCVCQGKVGLKPDGDALLDHLYASRSRQLAPQATRPCSTATALQSARSWGAGCLLSPLTVRSPSSSSKVKPKPRKQRRADSLSGLLARLGLYQNDKDQAAHASPERAVCCLVKPLNPNDILPGHAVLGTLGMPLSAQPILGCTLQPTTAGLLTCTEMALKWPSYSILPGRQNKATNLFMHASPGELSSVLPSCGHHQCTRQARPP